MADELTRLRNLSNGPSTSCGERVLGRVFCGIGYGILIPFSLVEAMLCLPGCIVAFPKFTEDSTLASKNLIAPYVCIANTQFCCISSIRNLYARKIEPLKLEL